MHRPFHISTTMTKFRKCCATLVLASEYITPMPQIRATLSNTNSVHATSASAKPGTTFSPTAGARVAGHRGGRGRAERVRLVVARGRRGRRERGARAPRARRLHAAALQGSVALQRLEGRPFVVAACSACPRSYRRARAFVYNGPGIRAISA